MRDGSAFHLFQHLARLSAALPRSSRHEPLALLPIWSDFFMAGFGGHRLPEYTHQQFVEPAKLPRNPAWLNGSHVTGIEKKFGPF